MEDLTSLNLPNIFRNDSENKVYKNKSFNNLSRNRNKIKYKKFYKNRSDLENQVLRNSFGKMILSDKDTSPQFSFGKEKRFYQDIKQEEIDYYTKLLEETKILPKKRLLNNILKHENIKNYLNKVKSASLLKGLNTPTDFLYFPAPTNIYKYKFLPKYSFSKSLRDLQKPLKQYEYYKFSHDKNNDINDLEKKWRNRIIGGDIGLQDRFIEDRKYLNDSIEPGPGMYNPNFNFFKYKQYKYGYMGLILDKNKIMADRQRNMSIDSYNMKYLLGIDKNKNKIINKNIRIKLFEKEGGGDVSNKIDVNLNKLRYLKKIIKKKLNSEFKSKENLSFNN